jgi:predicted O-methyltransferase YrrM
VDLYELIAQLARRARSYLEIGVQEGGSLRRVVAASQVLTRLVLCDTWGNAHGGTGRGSHAHIDALLDQLGYQGEVLFLDGRSQDTLPTLDPESGFDLVFVDGDHTTEGAAVDLELAWRVCSGVMVAHDIEYSDVWNAVLAFGKAHGGQCSAQVCFGGHCSAIFTRV